MFLFDVETLGVDSNAVILSAALIHFDPTKKPSYQDLLDDALFVKFYAKEQVEMGRSVDKNTLQWWKGQHPHVQDVSLKPNADQDQSAVTGVQLLQQYVNKYDPNHEATMWARGSLDQIVIDHLTGKLDLEPITGYNRWRDVRTAVDLLTGSSNGYCDVDYPGFDRSEVIKHHPVHDCALDAMMLMYGK